MAIVKDKDGQEELKLTIARRLKAARLAAGMKLEQAAEAIGHKGVTQLSLAETGDRIPPLLSLIKLANEYCVPLDFICGIHDDPIADPIENNQAVITKAVSDSTKECFEMFCKALSDQAAVAVSGQRQDRKDLMKIRGMVADAVAALNRIKLLNPEFEEDWRGSANLESALQRITELAEKVHYRVEHERKLKETIEHSIPMKKIENGVFQFLLEFTNVD